LELRMVVKSIAANVRDAASVDEVIESVAELAPALAAHTVKLELRGVRGIAPCASDPLVVRTMSHAFLARFPIEPAFGHLEIEWRDGRLKPDRDHEIAAETLCRAVSRALEHTLPDDATADAASDRTMVRRISTGMGTRHAASK